MTELNFNFILNKTQALEAYKKCEQLIRKIEEIGSYCKMEEYGEVDWLQAAQVFSVVSVHRLTHLTKFAAATAASHEKLQELGYEFVMQNCAYENATAYFLEGFRQMYVERNSKWNTSFDDYIDSIYVEVEGERYFKYFGHTDNPIFVQ